MRRWWRKATARTARAWTLRAKRIACQRAVALSRPQQGGWELGSIRRVEEMLRLETQAPVPHNLARVELQPRLGRADLERAAARRIGHRVPPMRRSLSPRFTMNV